MSRASLVLVPLLAVLGLTATASAQSTAERFRRAVARYESSQYTQALRDFQMLYEDTEEPALLYNIARCQEQLGDLDAASTSLRRYLDRVPDASDRAEAAQLLEDIDVRRQQAEASPPPDPEPSVEPRADPDPPVQEPQPAPPEAADDTGLSPLAITGITLLAVGGAGVIVGATLGGMTASEDASLREAGQCGATRSCTDEDLSTLRALGAGADVGLFVGGAFVAAGVVLLIVGLADGGDAAQAALQEGVRF